MRFENFPGRESGISSGTPFFERVLYSIYKQKRVPEPLLDSLPESLRTSLSFWPLTLQSLFLFDFLVFFSDFPCFLLCVFLPFTILWVLHAKRKTLVFFGVSLAYFQKRKGWGSEVWFDGTTPEISSQRESAGMDRSTSHCLQTGRKITTRATLGRLMMAMLLQLPCMMASTGFAQAQD